ncbi:hypothetical protein CRE_21183 [Caenorhabditis remanei]|uniref:Uncharacterized protein n=1 Tax=Caenorhabditis remanei TaxID=31234 RepID=E3MF76_CAERE|nr:hypothetical protein CRE_21183 [Caenorhabditis remanei]
MAPPRRVTTTAEFRRLTITEKVKAIKRMKLFDRATIVVDDLALLGYRTPLKLKHADIEEYVLMKMPEGSVRQTSEVCVTTTDHRKRMTQRIVFGYFINHFRGSLETFTDCFTINFSEGYENHFFGMMIPVIRGNQGVVIRCEKFQWRCTPDNHKWIETIVKFLEPDLLKTIVLMEDCTQSLLNEISVTVQFKQCEAFKFNEIKNGVKFDLEKLKHFKRLEVSVRKFTKGNFEKLVENFRKPLPVGSSFIINTKPGGMTWKNKTARSSDNIQKFATQTANQILIVKIDKNRVQRVVCREHERHPKFDNYIKVEKSKRIPMVLPKN